MKTIQIKSIMNNLNSRILPLSLLLGLGLFIFSCDKEDTTTTNETQEITNEEAAEIVEAALVAETQGIAKDAEEAAYLTEEYLEKSEESCGIGFDSTLVWDINTSVITADYNLSWAWELLCQNNFPVALEFSRTLEGNYETQRWLSDDSANSDWLVDDIILGSTYIMSGSYNRSGSQTSKVREERAFESTINITISELKVDKSTYRIESGSGTFLFSASGSGGNSGTYEGTIEFLGDGAAIITINGETFEIDLY